MRGNPDKIKGRGFDVFPEHINKKGAPKKLPSLEKLLIEVLGSEDEKDSQAKEIIKALLNKALKGDVRAAEVLLERGYGKVVQAIEANVNVPKLPDIIINKHD